MKLNDNFITHDTNAEQIMVSTGDVAFNGLVRNNKTAAFIVDCLKEETTKDKIVEKMLEKYEVSRDVLEADVEKILNQMREIGALDE